jgi:hypothetical protein
MCRNATGIAHGRTRPYGWSTFLLAEMLSEICYRLGISDGACGTAPTPSHTRVEIRTFPTDRINLITYPLSLVTLLRCGSAPTCALVGDGQQRGAPRSLKEGAPGPHAGLVQRDCGVSRTAASLVQAGSQMDLLQLGQLLHEMANLPVEAMCLRYRRPLPHSRGQSCTGGPSGPPPGRKWDFNRVLSIQKGFQYAP